MSDYLLGIDYGTGGAKACIIDENAEVIAYSYREYKIITSNPGWSEHDAENYWKVACEMIKECIQKSGVDPTQIKGIGTSSALPSMVLVDSKGNPVHNAYNLMDRRATEEVKWIRDNIGEDKIYDVSANRLEDHPLIVNILWEKNNRPEDFKRIYKVLTIDGFIRMRLTGKPTVSYSCAAFYGVAYNIRQRKFDGDILAQLGIDSSILPELVACEDIIGETTGKAALETGLCKGIKVAGGQVDCNAGWLGGGAIEAGDVQINLGTCGNIGVIHDGKKDFIKSMIHFPYTINSESTYITAATTTTGGQSLRFLRDGFSQLEVAIENLAGISSYKLLDMEAEKVAPGSNGLIILPYLMGERTPIWDVNARGVIFGLSLNHTKAHVVRAMLEGVAYALYDSLVVLQESNMKMNVPFVLNEGGASSNIWRRIITDVFNIPTVVVKSRVGAPFGDAILAGVATGVFKDYTIAKEKTEYVGLMEPDPDTHRIYMEYYKVYKNLYNHLKDDFVDLKNLRNL